MTEDTSLDLTGVGKLAKAIPAKAWIEVVHTACETFREAIAPFTATTSGVARLIEAKFDRLVDAEKLLAADVVRKASQKAQRTPRKKARTPQPKIVVAAIEASANETDVLLRDLWSNLLAQELVDGQMHPEFPRILSRLSTTDARVLAWVASQEKDKTALIVLCYLIPSARRYGFPQHGHCGRCRAMARARRKRTVVIDHGMWRCIGSSPTRAEAFG